MTGKRFTCEVVDTDLFRIETITDNDKGNVFSDCKTVTELLNKFCEENDKIKKENEQLKADNNRLVNETARTVAEHQGRILDLIDKSLEKDKHYYEMSYESYLNGRIEALEDLKKELTEQ